MTVILHEGERLTHETDGSLYATVLSDVLSHEEIRASKFRLADGTMPMVGSILPADVFLSSGFPVSIRAAHMEDGWRVFSDYTKSIEKGK